MKAFNLVINIILILIMITTCMGAYARDNEAFVQDYLSKNEYRERIYDLCDLKYPETTSTEEEWEICVEELEVYFVK